MGQKGKPNLLGKVRKMVTRERSSEFELGPDTSTAAPAANAAPAQEKQETVRVLDNKAVRALNIGSLSFRLLASFGHICLCLNSPRLPPMTCCSVHIAHSLFSAVTVSDGTHAPASRPTGEERELASAGCDPRRMPV